MKSFLTYLTLTAILVLVICQPVYAQTNSEKALDVLNRNTLPSSVNTANKPIPAKEVEQKFSTIASFAAVIIKSTPVGGLFDPLSQVLNHFLGFPTTARTFSQFFPQVSLQHQAQLPDAVKSTSDCIVEAAGQNLGSNIKENCQGQTQISPKRQAVGIYQENLPETVDKKLDKTVDFEEAYEKANYPNGICPITGCKQ